MVLTLHHCQLLDLLIRDAKHEKTVGKNHGVWLSRFFIAYYISGRRTYFQVHIQKRKIWRGTLLCVVEIEDNENIFSMVCI